MCGLAGIISSESKEKIHSQMSLMLEITKHRGPDGSGIKVFDLNDKKKLALGHNRLAIIDTSDAGLMPMKSKDEIFEIIFNGEIFNYIELRNELKELGYSFITNTDTEVLLNAYIEWGDSCLNKLNGMFSFAIFNNLTKELFIARDRYGVKPLYYYSTEKIFIFSSEIKSILQHHEVITNPNNDIIGNFLMTGISDFSSDTFFENIFSLPAGHFLILKNNEIDISSWYTPELGISSEDKDYNLKKSKVEDLFYKAVKLRLRSDVEVGACLSGGMDSSAIVGAIARISLEDNNKKADQFFKTFSATFEDPLISEKKYVDEVTMQTNTNNYSITPDEDGLWKELPKIIWHNDAPIQSPSVFLQWSVMQAAKEQGIKVTLDGQGADELAAGYPAYYSVFLTELIQEGKLIDFFKNFSSITKSKGEGRARRSIVLRVIYFLLPNFVVHFFLNHLYWSFFPRNKLKKIFKKEYFSAWQASDIKYKLDQKKLSRSLRDRLMHDFKHFSLPALLRYEDRSSMAFSIEARTPFLDFRLVEEIWRTLSSDLIRYGQTKSIIRDSVKSFIPEMVSNRTDKKGFPAPSDEWLRKLKPNIKDVLSNNSFIERYINVDYLINNNFKIESDLLWRLLFLELWFQQFFIKKGNKVIHRYSQ